MFWPSDDGQSANAIPAFSVVTSAPIPIGSKATKQVAVANPLSRDEQDGSDDRKGILRQLPGVSDEPQPPSHQQEVPWSAK